VDDLPGVAYERSDVGAHEHLAVTEPQHERAAVAGDDQDARVLGVDHGDAVGPDDVRQRGAHCSRQICTGAQRGGDQVREHLGVGLGDELDAVGGELGAQVGGVLEDPVVHDGHAAGRIGVRVRVDVVRRAVGRPAGVADAGGALRALRECPDQLGDVAGALVDDQPAGSEHGHPGGVVAAVLQPAQPVDEHGDGVLLADVGDDAAHGRVLPVRGVGDCWWCRTGQP
jgi:hypothetical protein